MDCNAILSDYPEFISKEQLHKICRISKRRATWLLEHGYIPCLDNQKKTHRFLIRATDVLVNLEQCRDNQYQNQAPVGTFSSKCNHTPKPPDCEIFDASGFREYLTGRWFSEPDALTTEQVVRLCGYSKNLIYHRIASGKLVAIQYKLGWFVPKDSLIEFVSKEPRAQYSTVISKLIDCFHNTSK